ncbi:hypothetical protein GCM10020254_43900 [Streptomyces goshikiensis]
MAEAADNQGAVPAPARRRWLRRAVVLLAGTPVLAALVYAPAPPAEAADAPVDVQLDTLAPTAPVKGDTLTISGTVVNNTREKISNAHVGLRVGPALGDRAAIDEVADRTAFRPGTDPAEIDSAYAAKIDSLPAKAGQAFTLKVPVNKLPLDKDGVYQLGVSLSGESGSRSYEQVLGIKRTFLPWQPEAASKRSHLAYAWPLISTTHLTAETGSDETQTPVFQDDKLADELKPGGRLEQMVTLGKELPITWVIDPDLLYTVDAMTKGYRVRTPDGRTVQGKNKAVAEQWLSSLEGAVQGKKVVALPFADPDIASLAHRGKDVSGTLGQLRPATDKAKQAVETVLHVPASTGFSWPVDGAIDPSIVNVATSAGAHNVLTRSDSLRETGSLGYTPRPPGPSARAAPRSWPTLTSPPPSRATCSAPGTPPSPCSGSWPTASPSTCRTPGSSAASSSPRSGCPPPARYRRWRPPCAACRAAAGRSRPIWRPRPRRSPTRAPPPRCRGPASTRIPCASRSCRCPRSRTSAPPRTPSTTSR